MLYIKIPYYSEPVIMGHTFKLKLDPKTSLSGATNAKLNYKKPSGEHGSFTGTISNDIIEYQVTASNLDETGDWVFWPTWDVSGEGKKGRAMKIAIKAEGTA